MRKKSWLLWAMVLVFGFAVMSGGCGGGGGGGENGGDEPVSDPQAANLSGLVLSAGVLSPSFSPETTSYTANVANDAAFVAVTPTAPHPAGETVTVNHVVVNSGSASEPIFLDVGENAISVIVTANDDPGNTRTYTVAVTREEAGGSATTGNWIDDGVADTSWYSPYDASRTVYEISTA
ncbi:MAG: cadherin-like beta sandwich domain-containing protein, partial [Synergistaceae bacterium]|nr:cadherin-like beta sandwich domain-containing protein [Synergistaceae bacterium]